MDEGEKKWFDAALDRVELAKQKGCLVLMVRRQDSNEEADGDGECSVATG